MKLVFSAALFLLVLLVAVTKVVGGTVTDIDGNVYQTVVIGNQEWMAENLRVTHYRDGSAIPAAADGFAWAALTTGAVAEYGDDSTNVPVYGRLYNWFAVMDARKLAPAGWHIPSDSEWQALIDFFGGSAVAGGKLKEAGFTHWASPNTGASDSSGFTALPGGYRTYSNGGYYYLNNEGYFWTSTEVPTTSAQSRYLTATDSAVFAPSANKVFGFSVRCIKDVSCCHGTRGNVNGSGIVDGADLAALSSYLTGAGYVLPCPDAANVNGNGIVDAADLTALISYLTGGGYTLPNCP